MYCGMNDVEYLSGVYRALLPLPFPLPGNTHKSFNEFAISICCVPSQLRRKQDVCFISSHSVILILTVETECIHCLGEQNVLCRWAPFDFFFSSAQNVIEAQV